MPKTCSTTSANLFACSIPDAGATAVNNKSSIFRGLNEIWRASRSNFPKQFFYFFTPKTCSNTSTHLFAHLTTRLRTAAIIKKPENPKKDIIL